MRFDTKIFHLPISTIASSAYRVWDGYTGNDGTDEEADGDQKTKSNAYKGNPNVCCIARCDSLASATCPSCLFPALV